MLFIVIICELRVDMNNCFFFSIIYRYLMDLIKKCGIEIKIGLVQTAYANGASTDYIQNKLVC